MIDKMIRAKNAAVLRVKLRRGKMPLLFDFGLRLFCRSTEVEFCKTIKLRYNSIESRVDEVYHVIKR